MALFGMILVHFHQKMEIPTKGIEDLVGWGIWIFLETKSWGMFAFLFGAGFAILIRRAEARGRRGRDQRLLNVAPAGAHILPTTFDRPAGLLKTPLDGFDPSGHGQG